MKLSNPYGNTASEAFKLARKRGVLPTWMGTQDLKELAAAIKQRAVFSARTTNAVYLEELSTRIQRFIANGYNGDAGKLRIELKAILTRLGYDPIKGFPGDEVLGVPPARAGSLQDLSSDRRLNLILDTQLKLLAGKGQQQQGMSAAALDLFPAYELIRLESRNAPREWLDDWETAAESVQWEGVSRDAFDVGRMLALKSSPIWPAIGSTALFNDALDVDHPPFRFSSGMGWRDVERAESIEAGLLSESQNLKVSKSPSLDLPPAMVSTSGLSAAALARLKVTLDKAEAKDGVLTLKSLFGNAPPPPKSRYVERTPRRMSDAANEARQRRNREREAASQVNAEALCDRLDCLLLLVAGG